MIWHVDFFNGWDKGVLQKAVDGCNCNPYGDFTCCVDKGLFTKKKDGTHCRITPAIDERSTSSLSLPSSAGLMILLLTLL